MLQKMSPRKQIEDLARAKGWGIRVLEETRIPESPVFKNGWWLEPLGESTMPAVATQRAQAVINAGVPVKGFIVAHQTTNLLKGKVQEAKKVEVSETAWKALGVLGAVAWVAAQIVLGVLALLVQVALVDPALIVVLEDGTAVEIARWYE